MQKEMNEMKQKLESLNGIGSVAVKRSGPTSKAEYRYTITFTSLSGPTCGAGQPCLREQNLDLQSASNSAHKGTVTIDSVASGVSPTWTQAHNPSIKPVE